MNKECKKCGISFVGANQKAFCSDKCRKAFKRTANNNEKNSDTVIGELGQIQEKSDTEIEVGQNSDKPIVKLREPEYVPEKPKLLSRPNLYSKSGKPPFEMCTKHGVFYSSCHC